MKYTAQELFEILNDTDECPWIEAKGIGDSTSSIMETVCSYSNEPGLGGGYILMSVSADDAADEPFQYKVEPIPNLDKLQSDLATQCASMFNLPVRPKITIEKINGLPALKIWVDELPAKLKPLYFKKDKLPYGALRRIGSTDQHCTEDDMHVFYQDAGSFDQSPVKGTSLADVDEHALQRYRVLREKVNPAAEELAYSDQELLEALGCVNKENKTELNMAGLMVFGTSKIQRSTYPMLRVDYIRVPGNSWVQNPDDRFITIDMRGPLLVMVYRLIDAINADLPKGFLLGEEDIQASSTGLPLKALREAIVNALMHRSYREHRPTQVLRYDNRIEIINPGYSLKPEERLGMPGSETRNPFIAAIFHDTNLAETKGSGIRAMRRLMQASHLAPPTFESNRGNNEFTSRMLLHHFLGEEDIRWLGQFGAFNLSDPQKQALLFVREVGAIDNHTYRQMADCDTLKSSNDLRLLKSYNLLNSKGKGKSTYYVAGNELSTQPPALSTQPPALSAQPPALSTPPLDLTTPVTGLSTQAGALSIEAGALNIEASALSIKAGALSIKAGALNINNLLSELPPQLANRIKSLKQKEKDKSKVRQIIKDVCSERYYTLVELSVVFSRSIKYISREYIKPMLDNGEMRYKYPEMIKHPDQAYLTNKKD